MKWKTDKRKKQKKIFSWIIVLYVLLLFQSLKFLYITQDISGSSIEKIEYDVIPTETVTEGIEIIGDNRVSIHNDPQIYYNNIQESVKEITIFMKLNENDLIGQLFFDTGKGFSEENSKVFNLKNGKNIVYVSQENVQNMRFDPTTRKGDIFKINKVIINDKSMMDIRLNVFELINCIWITLLICLLFLNLKDKFIIGSILCLIYAIFLNNKYNGSSTLLMCFFVILIIALIYIHKNIKPNIQNWEKILLVSSFFLFLNWSLIIPFNKAPDEYMRFDIINYLLKYHELPNGYDIEIRNPIWGTSYAFTPYLSVMISAFLVEMSKIMGINTEGAYVIGRFASVLFSTFSVFFIIKISKEIMFPKYQFLFSFAMATLPQFVFLSSYVNNESLAMMGSFMSIYYFLLMKRIGWNWKNCIWMGIGISIIILSYYNFYIIILGLFIWAIFDFSTRKNYKEMAKKGLFIIAIVSLLSSWWFIRNYLLYEGDFLGLSSSMKASQMYADPMLLKNKYVPAKSGA